jgi:hypothetical protein
MQPFKDIHSNILFEKNYNYYSSKSSLVKLSLDGVKVWETPLPTNYTSSMALLVQDTSLYLVNIGSAYKDNKVVKAGVPFIFCYAKKTGQLLNDFVYENKNVSIRKIHMTSNNMFILQVNDVAKYNLQLKQITKIKRVNMGYFNEKMDFVNEDIIIEKTTNEYDSVKKSNNIYSNRRRNIRNRRRFKYAKKIQL